EKFSILYTEEGSGRFTTYKVENSDIPSSEVKTIYIKERYYFDQRSSQFEVMVEAICPVLHRGDEWG
ncbi:MAG TPA: gliding motility protein GldN, partial [Porphyromonadaceae bacterium]|nr:gliding motility protein GldN [Porphyromonadaceae bacterium]